MTYFVLVKFVLLFRIKRKMSIYVSKTSLTDKSLLRNALRVKSKFGDPHDCLGGTYKRFGKKLASKLDEEKNKM